MIKFFRRIRQRLLSENKFSKYLIYAVGEILLVVIGILIALKINNWNEQQKSNSKAQDYYVQLLEDLNGDISFAKNTINEFSQYMDAYEKYLDSYASDQLVPNEVYDQLAELPVLTKPLTFKSSTLESLQNSGDLGLIRPDIRNRLIDLRRLQDLIMTRYEYVQVGKSSLLEGLSPLIGARTLPKRLDNQPIMRDYLEIDKNTKELILIYEAVHRWKSIGEQEVIDGFENMLQEIETIISLINDELRK